MVVLYYTSTSFLDVILETIQSLKHQVELHVMIEISENSKQKGTIVNVAEIQHFKDLEDPEVLLGKEKWAMLKDYFTGVASVKFVVQKNPKSISFSTLGVGRIVGKYMRKNKVEIVHFDTISIRALGLVPYLINKKVFITFHDPVPHSGELDWRDTLVNKVFIPKASGFFFYSVYAENEFKKHFTRVKKQTYSMRLHPYTYISKLLKGVDTQPRPILFFGRLSYYKGIDLLLEAIPKVLEVYPDEKFLIAGSASYGYTLDDTVVKTYPANIQVISKYLLTEDLVELIEQSKFIVCPYRDATQSGVLMTALAAKKMVVATNVGSFSEYIDDNVNGLLAEPTPDAIAAKIIEALTNDHYLEIEKNLDPRFSEAAGKDNEQKFLTAYKAALK
ncbi:glycosyltransferase family 4 protein [Ferruginibacter sp. HRS2-29]|uniref:glycosyltransferase family 4 protein n=1 Tax=Ferruginibacter sp. HRS2-29 TaxID=2487334 RepID=UPI0020CEB173|nr:glycosyltransferase family 4 protein [Ferruginibacter sp. HRS2-29]MCP9751052.1 glycosyltransferase [Ferruginibacter sp. HRS2-29]